MSNVDQVHTKTVSPIISAKNAWILAGVLIVAFGIGTFFDLQISEALLDPTSPVGIFGAAYGEYPMGIMFFVGGLMLIMFRNKKRTGLMVTQIVLGGLVTLIGAAVLIGIPLMYIESPLPLIIGINVVLTAVIGWVAFKSLRGVNRTLAIRVATVIVLISIAELILVNIIKIGWERPRMRMLMENPDALFLPWWNFGNPDRAALIEAGVAAEEFKSFPSGHTANGAVAIAFSAFTVLKHGWDRYSPHLFWLGALWGGYVGISRIIVGAHFLTDIVGGFAVTFICVLVAYRVGLPVKFRESQEVPEELA